LDQLGKCSGRLHAESCFREHQERPGTIAGALGKKRVKRWGFFELHYSVRVHASFHCGDDIVGDTGGFVAEMNGVLDSESAGQRAGGLARRDADENVAGKEWCKSRARAHEREEREKILAAEIELNPALRAGFGINELPGSLADVRHVGVAHFSDIIHNEGNVQSASWAGISMASAFGNRFNLASVWND
jgi:hypothetical protein